MKRFPTLFLVVATALLLNACASKVSPTVSSRGFQGVDSNRLNQAVAQAFINSGYDVTDATWEQETASASKDGKPITGTVFKYGAAKLPSESRRSCMKLSHAEITSIPEPQFSLVELHSLQIICYPALNKFNVEVDTDEQTYTRYFQNLSTILGQPGIPVGEGN